MKLAAEALKAYGAVEVVGPSLLPAVRALHERIATDLAEAVVALAAGKRAEARGPIQRSNALMGVLKRAVLPESGALGAGLVAIYDYLQAGLRQASLGNADDRVAIAFVSMRSLSAAWAARR